MRAVTLAHNGNHRRRPAERHPVGGHRVARPAQRRLGVIADQHDGLHGAGRFENQVDDLLCGNHSVTPFRTSVEHVDSSEQRRRAAVTDGRHLTGLRLAAVERPTEAPGRLPANGFHRVPEVGRRRLVGDIAQLAVQPAVADPEEPLPGELEVVALLIDGEAAVALHVDAVVGGADGDD